jgi:hypothetical protein
LLQTWRRRRGRRLLLESYAESGGVDRAIARTADKVFDSLSREQQGIARQIFLRLTEPGQSTPDTRRQAELSELIPRSEEAPAVESVLLRLADARLVTTGQHTAEMAHEALISEWPRLRDWLDEDRAGLLIRRRLTEAAKNA